MKTSLVSKRFREQAIISLIDKFEKEVESSLHAYVNAYGKSLSYPISSEKLTNLELSHNKFLIGKLPILVAAKIGSMKCMNIILDKVLVDDCRKDSPHDGNTALTIAVKNNYVEMAKFLIERGADICHKNINDDTVLHIAANEGHKEMLIFLLENQQIRQSLGNPNKQSLLPIQLAQAKNHNECFKNFI